MIVFLAFAALRSRQAVMLEDQLDPSLRSSRDLLEMKEAFPSDLNVGLIVNPGNLCELEEKVHALTRGVPDLTDRFTIFDVRQAETVGGRLLYSRRVPPCAGNQFSGRPLPELLADTPWKGLLSDQAGTDTALFFSIAKLDRAGPLGHFNGPAIKTFLKTARALFPGPLRLTGLGLQEYFTYEGMGQTQALNGALVLLLLLCLRALFGTWRAGAVFLSCLGFTCALVYGGMAALGCPLDTLAVCLTMMLAIAALEDFVFLSYAQMRDPGAGEFERLIAPSFFTSFTTMIGFGSLAVSQLSSIARFGAFAAFGALLEWIAFFLILPALGKESRFFRRWVDPRRALSESWLKAPGRWVPPRWLARLGLIVFPIAVFGVAHMPLSQDPSAMFPKDHLFQRSLEYMRSSRSWVAPAYLVFGNDATTAWKEEALDALAREPIVDRIETYDSVVEFVSRKARGPHLRDLIARELSISPVAERFHRGGRERALLYLKSTNTAAINALSKRVTELCPDGSCKLVGEYVAFAEFSLVFIRTLFESLLVSLTLVGLVLGYLSRGMGFRQGAHILIASFWGVACMLSYLFLTKSNANSVTCIVASTVVGLTGDNAIQFIFSSGTGSSGIGPIARGLERMAGASIACTMTISLACLVFLGSYFEPPRELGILFVIGFVASLIGDIWVLRGLGSRTSR